MTDETSVQDGRPIELYTFTVGTEVFTYTSAQNDYLGPGSVLYSAVDGGIQRSNFASTEEEARNRLTLTVARDFPIADFYRVSPPAQVISLVITRLHLGTPLIYSDPWSGRVLDCSWENGKAKLSCEPVTVSLKRTMLHRLYSRNCRWGLYQSGCEVSAAYHAWETTVTDATGSVLSVSDLHPNPAYSYAGGYVEWTRGDGIVDRRYVRGQSGTDLTLLMPFQGIAYADAVTLYPGCDHTAPTCNNVFNNILKYGGFLYFPTRNPFDGNRII